MFQEWSELLYKTEVSASLTILAITALGQSTPQLLNFPGGGGGGGGGAEVKVKYC